MYSVKKLTMVMVALVDVANIVIARVVVADVVGPSVEVPVSQARSIIGHHLYARRMLHPVCLSQR